MKFRNIFKYTGLIFLTSLGACTNVNKQDVLRQTVLSADATYRLTVMALIPIMQDKVPNVKLTQEQKSLLKRVSNVLASELATASNTIGNGGTLSELTVNTLKDGVNAYASCLENIKETTMPKQCTQLGV